MRRIGPVAVAVAALAATGCSSGDDFVARYGEPDFRWGFGLDSAEQLLEILVTGYHLSAADADCAVATIFAPDFTRDPTYGAAYTVTSDVLDRAMETCRVDTSTIWTHTD